MGPNVDDRVIRLGNGLPAIPERLLLAHARGEVLFICGAGVSQPADLPDFRELVLKVYQELDEAVYNVIEGLPRGICNQWQTECSDLTYSQAAEVRRFILGDYDVVLGMLERRLENQTQLDSSVRQKVAELLRPKELKPVPIHRTLMRLADRGGVVTIVTTNFDLLFEAAGKLLHPSVEVETYSLGTIPRPTRRPDFAGVLHIHGALDKNTNRFSELVLSDQDFGEYYLSRRVVPDFIYDAARLFHLVLVGYSAADPPMRYLLNAVEADGSRFDDLKERFTFHGTCRHDPVTLEDWKARGITPIHYNSENDHTELNKMLERWAKLSAINGKTKAVDKEVRRIVKASRADAPESNRDLFDHLLRRSDDVERVRLSELASDAKADPGWLDAIVKICGEKDRGNIIFATRKDLDGSNIASFPAMIAFLKDRLDRSDTIEWALRLKPDRRIERMALVNFLNTPDGANLDEPWASAWRLIEESWSQVPVEEGPSTAIFNIRHRLCHGDRSGALVSAIVNLVVPCLSVTPLSANRWQFDAKPPRPEKIDHLLSARLTSGDLVDLDLLKLAQLTEIPFLVALANALEAAVIHGLDIVRRIDWDGESQFSRMGFLYRVSYAQLALGADGTDEPDACHRGIAPAVKLLHAVVARITELDSEAARPFVQRWRLWPSHIHLRLWAAAALNSLLVSAEDVGEFLMRLNDYQFWKLYEFPEVAKLRALRFTDLHRETQGVIAARLRKLPPRNHWPEEEDAAEIKSARLFWAVRELKRIEIAGGNLPLDTRSWLKGKIGEFDELSEMTINDGFLGFLQIEANKTKIYDQYDTLQDSARLRTLEAVFSSDPDIGNGGPATHAYDWLQQPENATLVLGDLEAVEDGDDKFPCVWNQFGEVHRPGQPEKSGDPPRDPQEEAERVLRLLGKLSNKILKVAIEGISHWLKNWSSQVIASPLGLQVWLRIWPIAVDATNTGAQPEEDARLSVSPDFVDEGQNRMVLETLNNPTGRLVGVFLLAHTSLKNGEEPFVAGGDLGQMREAVIGATDESVSIARYRMIEYLPYFLSADCDWTKEHLIAPLFEDNDASLDLWPAIAPFTYSTEVLKIIGCAMADRAADTWLEREIRQRLVFRLVIESLQAFRETREPAVPNPRIQQMLRSLDDEVRAKAANAIQWFVREYSKKRTNNQSSPTAAALFQSAAKPFLEQVWPKERSLATPGVSRCSCKIARDVRREIRRSRQDYRTLPRAFPLPVDA